MNTVTLMVTLHFPGDEPVGHDREMLEFNVTQSLQVGFEDGAFNGCSHFEVEVEDAD